MALPSSLPPVHLDSLSHARLTSIWDPLSQLRISLVTTSRAWQGSFTDDGLLEHASQSGIKNPSLSTIQTLIRRAFRKPGRLEVSLASLASDSCELVLSYLMGRSGIQLLGSLELKIAPPRVIQQVLSSLMKHFQEQQCWAGSDSAEEERKSDGARDRKEEKRRALLRAIDSTGDEILSSSQLRQELDLAEQSIADLRAEIDRLRTCNRELSLVASGSSGSQFSSADQDSSLERLSASIPDRSIIAPHKRRRRQRGLKYK